VCSSDLGADPQLARRQGRAGQRARRRRGRRQGRVRLRADDDPLLPGRGADPAQRAQLPVPRRRRPPLRARAPWRTGGEAGQRVRRLRHADRPARQQQGTREVPRPDRGRPAPPHGPAHAVAVHRADHRSRRAGAAAHRPAAVHPLPRRYLRDHRWPHPGGDGRGLAGGQFLPGRRRQGHLGGGPGGDRLMLSRVASQLYWFSRYLRRAENTARLVGVGSLLQLDLPRSVRFTWRPMIANAGAEELFLGVHPEPDEADGLDFLLLDARNPSSLRSSVAQAREILRSIRDALPQEVWESVNDLHLYLDADGPRVMTRRYRLDFIGRITDGCLKVSGLLQANVSRDIGFQFLRLGTAIEQADMTTRIIDAGASGL